MNWPGAAARRTSIAGLCASSSRSVCSIITTASAPRGITPPVASAVAVPGRTSICGACPQAITSRFNVSRRGAASLAPVVSDARTAKPSTPERSNGGTSIGAPISCASTRPSDAANATDSTPRGDRSRCWRKRCVAVSADTTSRNCSCRAARRTASIKAVSGLGRRLTAAASSLRQCLPDSPRSPPAPASIRPHPQATAATGSRKPAARPVRRCGGAG